MAKKEKFDVIVVGSGITGLSTVYHLRRLGLKRVGLISDEALKPASRSAMGVFSGGFPDNFTRLSHAHGMSFAAELWRFGDRSFAMLAQACGDMGVPFNTKRRLRLVTSDHELAEAAQAVTQLKGAGFKTALMLPSDFGPYADGLSERILAIQDDGEKAGCFDVQMLLSKLAGESLNFTDAHVTKIKSAAKQISLTLTNGETIDCEMVVLATHLNTGKLLPSLSDVFISTAEQWADYRLAEPAKGFWAEPGVVFSGNHGYEMGVFVNSRDVHFSAGRFLRKLAGIGAEKAKPLAKITQHATEQLQKTFTFGTGAKVGTVRVGLDCRPCDELPIIGGMFGEHQIFLAGGYMGAGLSLGFYAGYCLAQLILKGKCADLPKGLLPDRLRSLAK